MPPDYDDDDTAEYTSDNYTSPPFYLPPAEAALDNLLFKLYGRLDLQSQSMRAPVPPEERFDYSLTLEDIQFLQALKIKIKP